MWLDSGVWEFDAGLGEKDFYNVLAHFLGHVITVEGNALTLCLGLRILLLSSH